MESSKFFLCGHFFILLRLKLKILKLSKTEITGEYIDAVINTSGTYKMLVDLYPI